MRGVGLTARRVAALAAAAALGGCIRIVDPTLATRYDTGAPPPATSPAAGGFNPFPQISQLPAGPFGHDFPQSAFAGFALNQITDQAAEAVLGVPLQKNTITGLAPANSTLVTPGQKYALTLLSYIYAPKGRGQPATQHPLKLALLVFFDHRLLTYGFGSGLPGESGTPVSDQVLDRLKQGKTTREQAIGVLGTPNVQVLHLVDNQPAGSSEIGYLWTQTDGGTTRSRNLRVLFDANDRMTNYIVQDNAHPSNVPGLPLPLPNPAAPSQPPNRVVPVPQADREHT